MIDRERKGAFYTPFIWVELSQCYLADVFGENWQDDHYIWDCAAGTGNLLAGLVNKDHVYASTLDQQDVEVMKDRIKNGANLWENHVFQFDFLNDSFEKLPKSLQEIISNPEKRKKLVIYINPPYAEATTAKTVTKTGENKAGVSKGHKANDSYKAQLGSAANEVFALFMARIYQEIPDSKLAIFSKLKFIQGTNYAKFKQFFLAKFLKGFIVRADSFDNVTGNFPIGFTIWDLSQKAEIKTIKCDIVENNGKRNGKKSFYGNLKESLNKWINFYDHKNGGGVGFMGICGPDFQNNKFLHISTDKGVRHVNYYIFNKKNVIQGCIYFAVRHCIASTWLNDRDQFLFPNKKWERDTEFQNDCLAFTLFHGQNRISVELGTNHWIPFTEKEVNAREKFDSHFMTDFIQGKLKQEGNGTLLDTEKQRTTPLEFSEESKAVFAAGKKLWTYYHNHINEPNNWGQNQGASVNAALYDIKSYFQGRNESGKMNNKSHDEHYNELIEQLRETLKILAQKIEPKVYDYGFLRE